jgi:hypothetical protein
MQYEKPQIERAIELEGELGGRGGHGGHGGGRPRGSRRQVA